MKKQTSAAACPRIVRLALFGTQNFAFARRNSNYVRSLMELSTSLILKKENVVVSTTSSPLGSIGIWMSASQKRFTCAHQSMDFRDTLINWHRSANLSSFLQTMIT